MKPISVLGPSGPKKRPFQSLRWAHRRRLQQHPAELVLPSILLEAQRCGHLFVVHLVVDLEVDLAAR